MRRILLVLLVVSLAATPAPAGAQTGTDGIDPDVVVLSISVEPTGHAVWTITYRVRLDADEEVVAFEAYRDDLESNTSTYRERFHNRMNATAEDARTATGRRMAIRNVSATAEREELPQAYGVVTYRFRWTNFASTSGDGLEVGDAVDGLFLDNETALRVTWPDEYELDGVSPEPTETRNGTVRWDGPLRFASGEPRVRLAPSAADSPVPVPGTLAAVALAVLLAAGLLAAADRRGVGPFGEAADAAAGGAPEPMDDALLSNEEQVLRLLEEQGGRMKQADVADELGWTDAKTSQVTTDLRDAGDLEAFRLGRENVLELPDDGDT